MNILEGDDKYIIFLNTFLIQAGLSYYPQNLPFPVLQKFKAEKLTIQEVSIGKKPKILFT